MEEEKKSEYINIRVVSGDKGEVFFKIRKTTPLKKLMESYCEKQGVSVGSTRFMFEDKRLNASHTAEEANLENDDLIEAYYEQQEMDWNALHSEVTLPNNKKGYRFDLLALPWPRRR